MVDQINMILITNSRSKEKYSNWPTSFIKDQLSDIKKPAQNQNRESSLQ